MVRSWQFQHTSGGFVVCGGAFISALLCIRRSAFSESIEPFPFFGGVEQKILHESDQNPEPDQQSVYALYRTPIKKVAGDCGSQPLVRPNEFQSAERRLSLRYRATP
jgi:hypothetical protein